MVKVILKNEPTLSAHKIDGKFNERRISLIPQIKEYITNNKLFNKEVKITFLEGGVSSLVSLLETDNQKFILKIPLSVTFSRGEGQFLKIWEENGVIVPHVIDQGRIGEHSYILYNYIDAKTIGKSYSTKEIIEKGIYTEIGGILRKMHSPKANGYGRVIDGKAEFSTFKDWIEIQDVLKRVKYVEENKLLTNQHGSWSDTSKTLVDFVGEDSSSSYCHEDFHIYNIFNTKPFTIFDPNPRFNHGYIDLGRSIYGIIFNGEPVEAWVQLIQGYFKEEMYYKKALDAAILFWAYFKLPYAHKTNKIENINNVQSYFIQNR